MHHFKFKMIKVVLKYFLIPVLFLSACNSNPPSVKEFTVHVWGNCEKCKVTIEKAAKIPGVVMADWDINSKLMTLKLDTVQTSVDMVLNSVAKAGYDNEKFYADDYAYGALEQCCQYDRRPFDSK